MTELLRTNDLVLISLVEAIFQGAGIRFFIADGHMSALEGSVGFLPRRVLVEDGQLARARQLLVDAGLDHELREVPRG